MLGDKQRVVIEVDVPNCKRCGHTHQALKFISFVTPVFTETREWMYWGSCPETGDPILMTKKAETDASTQEDY